MGASSVYSLFQEALRRTRQDLRTPGPLIEQDGACARFSLSRTGRRVLEAEYECTTCITLVALCEYLRRTVVGLDLESVAAMVPRDLLASFPEIPKAKRARAALAVRAIQAACKS
ncbi:MAG TPA: iron-sulfur cluster assembly scaffold protein [Bryobacteraceae bacterium]|nr:iron-sulfur cluster assembly scaffold protein [Bryobacteraceae bacterium]